MARIWETPALAEPARTPSGHAAAVAALPVEAWIQAITRALSDLPTLSRYVGHLTLLLVVLAVVRNVVPQQLQRPTLGLLSPAGQRVVVGEYGALEYWDWRQPSLPIVRDSRHLEYNAVPLTSRVLRDILPVNVPQRQVRTSVMVYEVQPNDTVLGIAQRFGLRGETLIWSNDSLSSNANLLQVGQKLFIMPVDGVYHTVSPGDTIESIAKRYEVEPEVILGWSGNGLDAGGTLQEGQRIVVPGGVKPYVAPRASVAASTSVQRVPAPSGAAVGSGRFVWPMSGMLTQRYWSGHRAIDIANRQGTPVVAADDGFVAVLQTSNVGYGNMIILDHGNGYQTLYAHLQGFTVNSGQSVSRGEQIGLCGSTGRSTGPHLHFEVIKDGVRQNPLSYLP